MRQGGGIAGFRSVDNITHSLIGLTLSNAGLRRGGRGTTAALLIASNIPDIEIAATLTGGRVAYLAAHRGPTHGPLGLLLGVGVAAIVWLAQRWRGRPREATASFAALTAVATLGVIVHIAMDFATSYGTRVLSPFVGTWFGVDWMPIVDFYLLVALAAGLIASAVRPAHRARIAAVVLLLAAGDYAFRAWAHAAALGVATERQAAALQSATVARPGVIFHYLNRSSPAALPAALPTLGSPFRWRLITRAPGGFQVCEIDLLSPRETTDAMLFSDDASPLVAHAASARLAGVFLDFSRFPAAETVHHRSGDVTVHWYDLRFAREVEGAGDGRRATSPFAVWVRLSPSGVVVGQGLGPG